MVRFLDRKEFYSKIERNHLTYIDNTRHPSYSGKDAHGYSDYVSFYSACMDWLPAWKASISRSLDHLRGAGWRWFRFLEMEGGAIEWKFAIVEDRIERGMPHTIYDTIVLPVWIVLRLVKDYRDSKLLETLVHERVHVLQKTTHRGFFLSVYAKWGWSQIERSLVPDEIIRTHRQNPDTQSWWVWRRRNSDEAWMPWVRLEKDKGYDIRSPSYTLYDIVSKKSISLEKSSLDLFQGFKRGCYHPEETSAVFIASAVMDSILHHRNDPKIRSEAFQTLMDCVSKFSVGLLLLR
jgi:hypothetical protein